MAKAPLETLAAREGYRNVSQMISKCCQSDATHQPALCMNDECDHVASVPVDMTISICPVCKQRKLTPLLMLIF